LSDADIVKHCQSKVTVESVTRLQFRLNFYVFETGVNNNTVLKIQY